MTSPLRLVALSTAIVFVHISIAATHADSTDRPSVSETVQAALESLSAETVDAWRQKAEQGYSPAQAKLGELLIEGGHGLSADLVDAYYWLSKAASAGDAQTKKILADLTTKMTAEQLSAAKANLASKR